MPTSRKLQNFMDEFPINVYDYPNDDEVATGQRVLDKIREMEIKNGIIIMEQTTSSSLEEGVSQQSFLSEKNKIDAKYQAKEYVPKGPHIDAQAEARKARVKNALGKLKETKNKRSLDAILESIEAGGVSLSGRSSSLAPSQVNGPRLSLIAGRGRHNSPERQQSPKNTSKSDTFDGGNNNIQYNSQSFTPFGVTIPPPPTDSPSNDEGEGTFYAPPSTAPVGHIMSHLSPGHTLLSTTDSQYNNSNNNLTGGTGLPQRRKELKDTQTQSCV
jgi:hypothetical protein